ncbi:ankyrin repeat domain-containing protein [Flavisphingomonas formosensis]|uniref:ankyrin repeat domain-containing protein n=1 Tax=Flavisphingomonas formosensis TaxID=861534 RepID=UPI001E56AC6E|nr:ankyrin repeat domain-containing protein [Sphingomonas formosensis]
MPATAQFTDSYTFLKAVKDGDGAKATEFLSKPGSTIVNTRDPSNGDTALHIVTKRKALDWMGFVIQKGANLDMRDNEGNSALMDATRIGFAEGVDLLVKVGASVDLANSRGETPLIAAVQNRDVTCVRLLLAGGASPTATDRIAGMSAHDYASRDPRAGAILKLLDEAKPKKAKSIVGPSL